MRGEPKWGPKLKLTNDKVKGHSGTVPRLHVSWNGSTETKKWRIYEDTKAPPKKELDTIDKRRFEMWVEVREAGKKCRYYMVEALDGRGEVIRKSRVVQSDKCR
uniref:Uncharacterized protein n=1 Tax=Vitrella brassicaformis TaxID=1169539 RepID=A0A7S1JLI7_9ALVE